MDTEPLRRVTAAFVPRDVAIAKRLALVLMTVAIATTIVFNTLVPSIAGGAPMLAVAAPLVALGFAITVTVVPRPPAWVWFCYPLTAVAALVLANLASHDASVTAQVFGFFPVLYAGAQLRRSAAAVVCAAAVGAEFVTTFAQLDLGRAVADSGFLAAALITMTAVLVHSAERVDDLVHQLRQQAAVDPLTGLVTRRVLDGAVASSLRSAGRDGGTAMIIVDVDHFKQVNDNFGHVVGDAVLRHVGTTLRENCRPSDIVARMGGDELAILMPGCSLDHAIERASTLLARISDLSIDVDTLAAGASGAVRGLRSIGVTASMGLAHLPTHATAVDELYRTADAALYAAKRAGRDRVCAQPEEPADLDLRAS